MFSTHFLATPSPFSNYFSDHCAFVIFRWLCLYQCDRNYLADKSIEEASPFAAACASPRSLAFVVDVLFNNRTTTPPFPLDSNNVDESIYGNVVVIRHRNLLHALAIFLHRSCSSIYCSYTRGTTPSTPSSLDSPGEPSPVSHAPIRHWESLL